MLVCTSSFAIVAGMPLALRSIRYHVKEQHTRPGCDANDLTPCKIKCPSPSRASAHPSCARRHLVKHAPPVLQTQLPHIGT